MGSTAEPETSVSRLEQTVSALETVISALETVISGRKTVISALETVISGRKTVISGRKTVISALKTVISALETVISGRKTVISGRKTVISGRKTVISDPENPVLPLVSPLGSLRPPLVPALLALAALVAFVPFADLPVLGAPLGFLVGSVLRVRRDHVETSLGRAGIPSAVDVAARMYASLGAAVMEMLWLAGAARRDLSPFVALDAASAALLDPVLASGRGAVFAASHTGNWELAACAMAQRTPLSVLVKPVSMGVFDRFMKRMRKTYGVGLLEGAGALTEARRELDAGRVVAVLVDQVPPREDHADWVPFLGADALTDHAAAGLAASAGVPLVVTASRRTERGGHELVVLAVWHPPTRGRTAWASEVTRTMTDQLAAFVRQEPSQWLWMHRRWKRPAAARLVTEGARR